MTERLFVPLHVQWAVPGVVVFSGWLPLPSTGLSLLCIIAMYVGIVSRTDAVCRPLGRDSACTRSEPCCSHRRRPSLGSTLSSGLSCACSRSSQK